MGTWWFVVVTWWYVVGSWLDRCGYGETGIGGVGTAGKTLGHPELTMFGQWVAKSIEKGVGCALNLLHHVTILGSNTGL